MNRTAPDTFCDVFDALEDDGVRYVVVGGVAVSLHGHARPVADLDLVVSSAPEEADRALRALTLAGFTPTIPLPLSALTVMRLLDREGREVDVFARFLIPFDELWECSERVSVGASVARVMSLAHLFRVKEARGQPRDLSDVEALRRIIYE